MEFEVESCDFNQIHIFDKSSLSAAVLTAKFRYLTKQNSVCRLSWPIQRTNQPVLSSATAVMLSVRLNLGSENLLWMANSPTNPKATLRASVCCGPAAVRAARCLAFPASGMANQDAPKPAPADLCAFPRTIGPVASRKGTPCAPEFPRFHPLPTKPMFTPRDLDYPHQ